MGDNGVWAGRGRTGRARRSGPTDPVPGVCHVTWNAGDRPDTFVVADCGRADDRWLRLADVVIQPAQHTVPLAEDAAEASFIQLSGCALTAVPVETRGHVLRWRDGRQRVIRTGIGTAGLLWWCIAEYTGRLVADRTGFAVDARSGTHRSIGASLDDRTLEQVCRNCSIRGFLEQRWRAGSYRRCGDAFTISGDRDMHLRLGGRTCGAVPMDNET
jgi:hypothetical protein